MEGPHARPSARLLTALPDPGARVQSRSTLPERRLSFLEVSSYCFLTHLEFRELLRVHANPRLRAFCARFGERSSALSTAYRFDQPQSPASH